MEHGPKSVKKCFQIKQSDLNLMDLQDWIYFLCCFNYIPIIIMTFK